MNILLSGDDCIYEFQNQYYVRNYGKVLIDRYLSVFDYVYLAWRTRNVKSEASLGQYNIPIDKRAKVIGIPFFQGPIGYARVYHKLRKRINDIPFNDISLAILRLPSNTGFSVFCSSCSN